MASLPTLYVSTAIAGDIAHLLGTTHYSYHFAAASFRALLDRHGAPARHLPMPEIYADDAALGAPQGSGLHLIFRSTEQIRLLKSAVNICCFPWEFPVLKTDTLPDEHPFANQARMLGLCDEVWTPSDYARRVLQSHGVANVHRIPAPVTAPRRRATRAEALRALADLECVKLRSNFAWPLEHATAEANAGRSSLGAALATHARPGKPATIHLSILNPEDFRKNLDALLRGFNQFRTDHPDAVLIVKALTSANRYTLPQVVADVVAKKLAPGSVIADDGIVFINAYLSSAQMSLLYALADFYVCTSIGEGQNLPLLEAMAHGTAAITTSNTAMQDYIDPDNAFIITAPNVPNDTIHLAGTVAGRAFDIPLCGAAEMRNALHAAHAAPRAERSAKIGAAIARVDAKYSEAAVWALVSARLAHHAR